MVNQRRAAECPDAMVHVMGNNRYPLCGCENPMFLTSLSKMTRFSETLLCKTCLRVMREASVWQTAKSSG